ncbi:MAG TPA: chemotaxis protein CheX [Methanothermococcus okinawensis]|nr:chemotaxis protein CheX [Methanothermococcus okinawensis]
MKWGNLYISPKSWEIIMESIINEEIMGDSNSNRDSRSNFVKNFYLLGLGKIEEIGKCAAKKAADFITNLTGNPVEIGVVSVMLITPFEIKKELKDEEKIFTGIKFSGEIKGVGVLIFSEESALKLSKSMLAEIGMDNSSDDNILDDMKISAINEACNLIISAYVDTLANFMNTSLNMTPPSFIKGSEKEIIEKIFKDHNTGDNDIILTFKSKLYSQGIGSGFEVLIIMPPDSLSTLFQKI